MAYDEEEATRRRVVVETPTERREVVHSQSVRDNSGISAGMVGVLSIPHNSWAVLSSGQFSPFGSFVGDRDEYRTKSKTAIANVDLDLLRELSVRYLYVDRHRAMSMQTKRVDALVASGELTVFWQRADGKSAIYEVVPTKP